jgi:hypothetical protein
MRCELTHELTFRAFSASFLCCTAPLRRLWAELELTMSACQDPEKPGVLQELKAQICENVSLFAQKYDEDFEVSGFGAKNSFRIAGRCNSRSR